MFPSRQLHEQRESSLLERFHLNQEVRHAFNGQEKGGETMRERHGFGLLLLEEM